MQQAFQYRDWPPNAADADVPSTAASTSGGVRRLISESAVVVFARRDCCMCHVVRLLLHGHGVNPTVFDVDEVNEVDVVNELSRIVGADGAEAAEVPQFPAIFVGGELFGGLEKIVGAHISGELVPRLREARALWL